MAFPPLSEVALIKENLFMTFQPHFSKGSSLTNKASISIPNSASHCPLLYLHFISLRRVWPADINTLLFPSPLRDGGLQPNEVYQSSNRHDFPLSTLMTVLPEWREGWENSKLSKKKKSVIWLSCLIVHFPGTLLNSWLISSEVGDTYGQLLHFNPSPQRSSH